MLGVPDVLSSPKHKNISFGDFVNRKISLKDNLPKKRIVLEL